MNRTRAKEAGQLFTRFNKKKAPDEKNNQR